MPLNLPDKLPAIELLKEENIFVIDTSRATQQDIRPLRIVILNLMPGWIEKEEAVRSSSGSMYGYDTRVPLIVYRPGQTPRRVDRKVEMRAVAPTVARLLGVPEPAACEAEELREATGE